MLEPKDAKKVVKGVLIALFAILMIVTVGYALKMFNGETCGRVTYTDYNGGSLQAAVTLDDDDERIYQHNPFNYEEKVINWRFCFTANATEAIELHVIDSAENILAHALIEDGYHRHCYNVVFPDNETNNYIGLRCDNCGLKGIEVILYEEILGADVERALYTGTDLTTFDANTLDFMLEGEPSCFKSIKYFYLWFLTGAALLFLIIGVVTGFKKIKEVLLSE